MQLTGKANSEFIKWYQKNIDTKKLSAVQFRNMPDNVQWGVYQDFFWSCKIPLAFNFLPVIMERETIEEAKEIQFKRCNDVLNLKLEDEKA